MDTLSPLIIINIFKSVNPQTLLRLTSVSNQFNDLAYDHVLWKIYFKDIWMKPPTNIDPDTIVKRFSEWDKCHIRVTYTENILNIVNVRLCKELEEYKQKILLGPIIGSIPYQVNINIMPEEEYIYYAVEKELSKLARINNICMDISKSRYWETPTLTENWTIDASIFASDTSNIRELNISGFNVNNANTLSGIHTVILRGCNVKDSIKALDRVHTLDLSYTRSPEYIGCNENYYPPQHPIDSCDMFTFSGVRNFIDECKENLCIYCQLALDTEMDY